MWTCFNSLLSMLFGSYQNKFLNSKDIFQYHYYLIISIYMYMYILGYIKISNDKNNSMFLTLNKLFKKKFKLKNCITIPNLPQKHLTIFCMGTNFASFTGHVNLKCFAIAYSSFVGFSFSYLKRKIYICFKFLIQ